MTPNQPDNLIRTGIPTLKNTALRFKTRPFGMAKVNNPILNYQVGSGYRASKVGSKPPFDIESIKNAYLADGIIGQAIDKYVEVVVKEGWRFDGNPEQVKYLKRRLDMMTISNKDGEPWELVFERAIRDFIKYGNCFLTPQRTQSLDPFPGLPLQSLQGKAPIGAYFNLPPTQMFPELDETGKIRSWIQKVKHRDKVFPIQNILHFTYRKEAGGIWGVPHTISVIEDIRALRQVEENILKLIYKNLNPLIHQQIPDITGNGEGRQEDIDDAVRNFQTMAPDGYIITPPGHKLQILGVESQALKAEEYLKYFMDRVFIGLGVSELIMGLNAGATAGTAEAITAQMHHRAKMYQFFLSKYFTFYILYELLMEGGYDPWNKEEDQVIWAWNEIEIDRQIKEQTHALNLWTMNAVSIEEARLMMKITEEPDWTSFYVHKIQIPQLIASKLGVDPINLSSDDILDLAMPSTQPTGISGNSKSKVPTKKITKTGDAAKTSITPSNQHTGPKAKPNAPTAHKMSVDEDYSTKIDMFNFMCEDLINLIPSIRSDQNKSTKVKEVLYKYIDKRYSSYIEVLNSMLIMDIKDPNEVTSYIRLNARLSNERATIINLMF